MHLRASDDDRQRVVDALQRHTEAGRLSLDEFSDRVGVVYQARTLSELAAATADLPTDSGAAEAVDELHDNRGLIMIFLLAVAVLVVFGLLYTLAG